MRRRRGNAMIETAMFVPLLILLMVGTAEIGRVTYTYYSAHKALYNLARFIGTRQGANLCDESDAEVLAAKNWAVSGATEGGDPIIAGLTADIIQVRLERVGQGNDLLEVCPCDDITGCNAGIGGRPPDYVVVSVPDGFRVQVSLPYLLTQTVVFRPSVRVPYGGT